MHLPIYLLDPDLMADSDPVQTPDVNQPVLLRDEESEYASRVEGLDGTTLTVARPFGLPLGTALEDGHPFDVEWTSQAGVYALPVRVTERRVDGKIRVWLAQPTGPARLSNRRAHVRVSVSVTASVEIDGRAYTGELLDVSEAAVRCLIRDPLPEPPADGDTGDTAGGAARQHVRVGFFLADQDFLLPGAIFRSTPAASGTELIIVLPEDERTASAVRRAVFAEQIRARQLAR